MNDISLIKLVRRIWFTDNILPACLQIDLRDVSSDIKVTVSGWGSISAERMLSILGFHLILFRFNNYPFQFKESRDRPNFVKHNYHQCHFLIATALF